MPTFDVTAFGETLLRYSVPVGERLAHAARFDVHVGGAESNVLAALAGLGRRCAWVSAVPDHDLGERVVRDLRAAGIDTRAVMRGAGRQGVCYVELAVPPRPVNVLYDRQGAAVTQLSPDDVPWTTLLDSRVLHLTGITPALGPNCAAVVHEAVQRARRAGVRICFDVNYRSKLWSPDAARAALLPLVRDVDILICGEGDAGTVFGLTGSPETILNGLRELSNAAHVVLTRSSHGACTFDSDALHEVPARAAEVIDRLGAGDAFAAGVIDGVLDGDVVAGLQRGSVLSALALTQHGDMVSTSRRELEVLLASEQRGIRR